MPSTIIPTLALSSSSSRSSSSCKTETADTVSNINACIKSKDFLSLKQIGISSGFGDNNTQRLRCYSILLGCGGLDVYDVNGEGSNLNNNFDDISYDNKYTKIIGRDIKRGGYSRWNKTANYSIFQKEYDLKQIEKLLNSVFTQYPEFNYIQSFDSVFSFFYLIANGNLFIAKRLIVSYLHIFKSDLSLKSDTFGQLINVWTLLKKYDSSFYKWLKSIIGGEEDVSFALEWYISWFSHSSIQDFNLILQIYDFMISTQNQHIGLYMVLSVLLMNKKKMMENVENLTDFIIFTKNQIQFNQDSVDKLLIKCYEIMKTEMKEEHRRNVWKQNKMEAVKIWREFKTASKSSLSMMLSL